MNIKNNRVIETLKKPFFFRQHPEAALRYLPIVEFLKQHHFINNKILEVGSGSYGITPYLKKPIVGVDTSFDEPKYHLLKQVNGSATNLPFRNREFDLVILSDVLEHIPAKLRTKAITEAVRVAKKGVVISGPFGKEAATQDKDLAEHSLKKLNKMHPFFEDHLKYGLPEVEDISKALLYNKRVKKIQIVGHFFNLKVRAKIMKIFITENKLQKYFYLKGLMPTVPVLRLMNKAPTYRTLVFVPLK